MLGVRQVMSTMRNIDNESNNTIIIKTTIITTMMKIITKK